jgi:hypothetical protein
MVPFISAGRSKMPELSGWPQSSNGKQHSNMRSNFIGIEMESNNNNSTRRPE